MWEMLAFLLNAMLFVLIGLQLPVDPRRASDGSPLATLLGYAAAVSAVVIGTRLGCGVHRRRT